MSHYLLEYRYADMDARARARAEHLDYMNALQAQGTVVMAGPLADSTGAVVLLDVADEDAVRGVIAGDPYTTANASADHRIREWNVIIPAQR
jgi:uncharacterized protein YciI